MTDPFALLASMPDNDIPAPGPLPAGSRMGLRANAMFVGREGELRTLARLLKAGGVAGVTGLGGMGKTQLASEFALRYGRYFAGGVFWLSFAEAANVPSEVAACGGAGFLALRPDFADLPQAEQVAVVRAAWDKEIPRLLVFDNCEEDTLLHEWVPRPGSGSRVLLTSRRATWGRRVPVQAIALGTLPREDSVALLAKFRPDLAKNPALDAIAMRLGNLPLALHLAGSYLETYQHDAPLGDPVHYLEQLARPDLLTHPSMEGRGSEWSPTDHEQSVARTFALSTEKLQRSRDFVDHLALALLHRAALFAPGEPIPRPLLVATLERSDSEEIAHENADAIKRLLALGLAEKESDGALTLHRLLALFAKETHTTPLLATVERVVEEEAGRLDDEGYPTTFLSLLPHLRHLTNTALSRTDERAAKLCNIMGVLMRGKGDSSEAHPYFERALAIREEILGPTHPDTATSINNMGMLLALQGDDMAALLYCERALAIREEVLGSRHADTATSLNNLGALLVKRDPGRAHSYFERALAIREELLGSIHLDTADSLQCLGLLLASQGEYIAARPYFERAHAICEQVLGLHHPRIATSITSLGLLLKSQGHYTEARSHFERALTLREELLGANHPDTAASLDHLGSLLDDQGEGTEAIPYYKRALAIYEKVLGSDHPHTSQVHSSLVRAEHKLSMSKTIAEIRKRIRGGHC